MAEAEATWKMLDPGVARERFLALGGLAAGEPLEVDLTVRRERLLEKGRPPLPDGALVIETERIGDDGIVPVATVRLGEGELRVEAMSEERLEFAIEAVDADFGDVTELIGRDLTPIERGLEEGGGAAPKDVGDAPPFALEPAERARLLSGFMTQHLHRWLDEPLAALGGETPREAVGGKKRGEVIRLVRAIENHAERARRRGDAGADVAWLCAELSIDGELAA